MHDQYAPCAADQYGEVVPRPAPYRELPPFPPTPAGTTHRHHVCHVVQRWITDGLLTDGDALPSTRELAKHAGLSRSVIVAAYDELTAAGLIGAQHGSRTVVLPGAAQLIPNTTQTPQAPPQATDRRLPWHEIEARAATARVDARCGLPDATLIDTTWWRRAWAKAAQAPIGGYVHDLAGPAPEALAEHLRRTRHIVAHPHEVVLFPTVAHAMGCLAQAAGWAGRRVAMEDPGYPSAVVALRDAGATVVPTGVDADGVLVSALDTRLAGVYTTPAHQYPLGGRLSADRRRHLLEWAESTGAVIIEDDFDGEFRYDADPLPALAALPTGREHVAYIGTASKVLTPSLRLCWMIPPPRLLAGVQNVVLRGGLAPNHVASVALAHLVADGGLARHIAKASRVYRDRREALLDAICRHLPQAHVHGIDAGLHVALTIDGLDDAGLVDRLAARGYLMAPLSRYTLNDTRRGILLGYARLTSAHSDTVCAEIASELAQTHHNR